MLSYSKLHPLRSRGAIGSEGLDFCPGLASVKEDMRSIQKAVKWLRFDLGLFGLHVFGTEFDAANVTEAGTVLYVDSI